MDVGEQIQNPKLRLDPTNLNGESRKGGTVSEHCFIRHLEFEKRRADRSRSPLSIALFHADESSANQLHDHERLVKIVRDSKRRPSSGMGSPSFCWIPAETGRKRS